MRRALLEQGHPEAAVEAAVSRLSGERALDDRRLAASLARARLAGGGFGRGRIRAELRRRGVATATAEAGLLEALRDLPEAGVLDGVIRRLARRGRGVDPRLRLRRLYAALLRRGFAPGLVRERVAVLRPSWHAMLEELDPGPAVEDGEE